MSRCISRLAVEKPYTTPMSWLLGVVFPYPEWQTWTVLGNQLLCFTRLLFCEQSEMGSVLLILRKQKDGWPATNTVSDYIEQFISNDYQPVMYLYVNRLHSPECYNQITTNTEADLLQ